MSGTNIGTPYSPTGGFTTYFGYGASGLSLVRYAHIIGYAECAFFGIVAPGNVNYACRNIWTKIQRDDIADYLSEAQSEIENQIGYPLASTWLAAEDHYYSSPLILNNAKLISLGTKAYTALGEDVAVSYVTEPATVIVPTTLTSPDDIIVFYPDTDIQIVPESMTISGGVLTIKIPKCRLLKIENFENPVQGWDGSDVSLYQEVVDVTYFYTDTSDQATLIYYPDLCDEECEQTTQTVCAFIDNASVGIVRFGKPAYSFSYCSTAAPRRVTVNYRAGLPSLTKTVESAIVRLAHSRMPTEPCGCDITQRLWKRDRNVPQVLDRERLNCPFGLSDGAWAAWKIAMSISSFRMSEFIGK